MYVKKKRKKNWKRWRKKQKKLDICFKSQCKDSYTIVSDTFNRLCRQYTTTYYMFNKLWGLRVMCILYFHFNGRCKPLNTNTKKTKRKNNKSHPHVSLPNNRIIRYNNGNSHSIHWISFAHLLEINYYFRLFW